MFTLAVNNDPSLIGDHIFTITVTSDDYSTFITPKVITVPVSVRCTLPPLVEIWSQPAQWTPIAFN